MIIITGANGFLGRHMFNYLKFIAKNSNIIGLGKNEIHNPKILLSAIDKAGTVIHFAGVNRSENENFIYTENIKICDLIIEAMMKLNKFPRFINISSIHEETETSFGKSKKETRVKLENYFKNHEHKLISLITPNIFGPYGKPNYNSFVATLCNYIIIENKIPLYTENQINLLYVDDLIKKIFSLIGDKTYGIIRDFETIKINISTLVDRLTNFWNIYLKSGDIPEISSNFERNLFNTFRSYIPYDFFPRHLIKHSDDRGFFAEVIRCDCGGQISISTSHVSIERGNHFHTRKIERFQIIKGEAVVQIRKIDSSKIYEYNLKGDNLDYIDIPIWHTHNLINNSKKEELIMLFWINEYFDPKNTDTYPLNVIE